MTGDGSERRASEEMGCDQAQGCNPQRAGIEVLSGCEARWSTRMGAWFPGERVVYRGKDLLKDLANVRWMELLLLGITGRRLSDAQVRLFEGMWVIGTSYPDPRLWNNRVAALAGTARSTAALAVNAANAASEATIYGHRPIVGAHEFLLRARRLLAEGSSLSSVVAAELRARRHIPGYGRPLTSKDERIEPLLRLAATLGFDRGPYLRLAFEVDRELQRGRWRMRANVAAVAAGLAADQGLTSQEYYLLGILCFSAGVIPCYLDALRKPQGSFFPLRCDRLVYRGPAPRRWTSAAPPPE